MVRPRQITNEALLEGARSCFLELGPAVSTGHIATHLGVSQGLLFQRFGSKDQLLKAALAPPPVPPWTVGLAQGPDERELPLQLLEIAREATDWFDTVVPCISVLRAAGHVPGELFQDYEIPPPLVAHGALAGWLREALVQERVRPCDPDAIAMTLLGALHIHPFVSHVAGQAPSSQPGPGRPAYLSSLVDLLWRGLAPEKP